MPTADLKKRVSALLRQYLPASPELKGFKLNKHSGAIAEFIDDPLLWVRLAYPAVVKKFAPLRRIDKHLFRDTTEIITRRLKVLEDCVLSVSESVPELTATVRYATFFEKILEAKAVQKCVVRSPTTPQSQEASTALAVSPVAVPGSAEPQRRKGVVVDIYTQLGVGYVCGFDSNVHGLVEAYELDLSAVVTRFPGEPTAQLPPLNIGDEVSFVVARGSDRVYRISSLTVTRYLPHTLDEAFLDNVLQVLEPDQCISTSPAWVALLNETRFYHKPKFLHQVLARSRSACSSLSNSNGTDTQTLEILSTLRNSSFLEDMASLFEQDSRRKNPSDSPDYQEYTNDIHSAIRLLATLIEQNPTEAYQLAGSAKQIAELPEQLVGQELKCLTRSLLRALHSPVNATCTVTSSPKANGVQCTNARDPFLWLRKLPYGTGPLPQKLQPVSQVQLVENEQVVVKRLEELTVPPVSISIHGDGTQVHNSWGPTLQGVITDIYPCTHSEPNSWEVYVMSLPVTGMNFEHEFYTMSTREVKGGLQSMPLHIGDVVSFKVSDQDVTSIASGTVKVEQYFPGAFNREDAGDFLLQLRQQGADSAQANILHELFRSPAAWKAVLDDPFLHPELLDVILAVYTASQSAPQSAMLQFMRSFEGSSFIRDITRFASSGGVHTIRESTVTTITELLADLLRNQNFKPEENNAMASALGQWFEKLSKHGDMLCLTLALIDSCLVPPHSFKFNERPWKSVPTTLTMEELDYAVQKVEQREARLEGLPKVKERGSYESLEEYGRTYFTLLREDCYGELIDAIARLKRGDTTSVYYDAHFVGLGRGKGQRLVFCFRFETPPLPKSSITDKALLREDNLIGLSLGGRFENDIVWATIDHTSGNSTTATPLDDSMGISIKADVFLQLCSEANEKHDGKVMEELRQSRNIIAVESPAYFRAYQPVLDALKKTDMRRIHFKDDLLDPSHEVKCTPAVFTDESTVDPSTLYHKSESRTIPTYMKVGDLKNDLESDATLGQFLLDKSQKEAVYRALTLPLTLIQGPPGTGKTYVGLKLLELFLSLSTLPKGKPILLMAYKNRALDHFIDQCQEFCPLENIVRIGHNSEGYDHLKEALLWERVKSSRGSIMRHRQKLQDLYYRILRASSFDQTDSDELRNFLPSMTPDWLKSLLLGAPEVKPILSSDLKRKLSSAPDECLRLLKRTSIMGQQDRIDKRELEEALESAWKAWTSEIQEASSPSTAVRRKSAYAPPVDTDQEEQLDYEEMEKERRMAADDFEDSGTMSLRCEIPLSSPPSAYGTEDDELPVVDSSRVWEQLPKERKQLIKRALLKCYQENIENLKEALHEYNEALQFYEWERQTLCLQILKKATIVAMTTTGAAIHQQLLNRLEAPVVFVEEAAEVLESNLLACLTPHVKHLILIGDHKQLKPSVACSRLKLQNKFNVSMFERLVNNNFPHVLLMRQSRMHPDLVQLFSYHYSVQKKQAGSQLKSTDKMVHYSHPSCMSTSFYWWTYSGHEEERKGTAIMNPHEAKMVVSLCVWLLTQGHKKQKEYTVSILTPYRAQLRHLREQLEARANQLQWKVPDRVLTNLSQLPVYTVDEFQGHESEIVILSLVRSNKKNQIGFLREKNRLVVGTSRQKRALYIIGNASFLKGSSPILWRELVTRLEEIKRLGCSLPIVHGSGHREECQSPEKLNEAAVLLSSEGVVLRQHSSPAAIESTAKSPAQNIPERKLILQLQRKDGVARNWKHIARCLDVSDPDIAQVQASSGEDILEAFYQMIKKWKEIKGEDATCKVLETALQEVGLKGAAQTVVKYIHE